MTLIVDENGAVSGTQTTIRPPAAPLTGNLAGALNYDGSINLYYLYWQGAPAEFSGAGTLALSGNSLTGSLANFDGTLQVATATVNLTK